MNIEYSHTYLNYMAINKPGAFHSSSNKLCNKTHVHVRIFAQMKEGVETGVGLVGERLEVAEDELRRQQLGLLVALRAGQNL